VLGLDPDIDLKINALDMSYQFGRKEIKPCKNMYQKKFKGVMSVARNSGLTA